MPSFGALRQSKITIKTLEPLAKRPSVKDACYKRGILEPGRYIQILSGCKAIYTEKFFCLGVIILKRGRIVAW